MAITSKNQRLITYKKLLGKSHTSAQKGITGEADPSSVQLGSSLIFGEEVNNDTIKLVEFSLVPADLASYKVEDDLDQGQDGASQGTKNHGWKLVLPSDYSENTETPKFEAGNVVSDNNKLQIIPDTYGIQYKPRVYADELMTEEILNTDREDWILDPFSGVLFVQDVFDRTPVKVQAYIYMGKYLDEALADAASTGGDTFWSLTDGDPDQIETSKSVAINVPLGWNYIDLNFQINEATKTKLVYIPEPQLDLLQGAYTLSSHDRFDIRVGNYLNPSATIKNNLYINIDLFGDLGPLSTFEIPKNFGTDRSMLIVNKPTNNDLWKLQGEAAVGQFWNSWTTDTVFGGPTVGLFSLSGPKENKFLFPSLGLYGSRGDDSSSSPIQSGDTIGRIVAYGNAASGQATFSWKPAAWIEFAAAENFTSNDGAATIRFCTTDNASNTSGTNVTERFSISHNGNVVSRSSFYALSQGTGNTSNIHIRKDSAVNGSNVDFVLSHRSSGKELWLYSSNNLGDFANFVSFKHEGGTTKKISFPADGNLFQIDLLNTETTTNGSSYIYPGSGKSALYLERSSGYATVKSLDGYLIMDSGGTATALNYFVSDDVLLARGGGKVGIGNIPSNQPDEMLEIYGDSPFIKLSNTAETESGILFVDTDDEINEFAKITFNSDATGRLSFKNDHGTVMYIQDDYVNISTLLYVDTISAATIDVTNLNIETNINVPYGTFDQITIENDQTGVNAGSSLLRIINSPNGSINGIQFEDPGTPYETSLIQLVGNLFKFKNTATADLTGITIHDDGNVVIGNTTSNLPLQYSMTNAGSLGIVGDLFVQKKSKFFGQTYFQGEVTGPLKIKQQNDGYTTSDVSTYGEPKSGLRIYSAETLSFWSLYFARDNLDGSAPERKQKRLAFFYTRGSDDAVWPNGSGERGYINADAGNTSLNFTGQHRNQSDSINLKEKEKYLGLIVVSDGTYASISSNSVTINEALPKVSLASKRNQKSAFGVVSDIEDENAETREYALGNFVSVNDKTAEDTRLIINSLGEGGIWVTNVNGNLENGDYITTCEIPGYGMKQDDDLLHNYTVAKITCDCDFNLESPIYICEEFEHEGTIYKRAFVGCTYHCG